MHSEVSSAKLKAQRNNNAGSHLATYQGEVIRKSICNDPHSHHPLKVPPLPRRRRRRNTRIAWSLRPARSATALAPR
jgi:hypothetical protein